MLLSYKPLHLEDQQRLQEEGCVVDINYLDSCVGCVFREITVDQDELLLSYKTLRLEAQHKSTRTSCIVDIMHTLSIILGREAQI
mgnify:CR=1 FL=1